MARISWKGWLAATVLALALGAGAGYYRYAPVRVEALAAERDVPIKVFGLGTVEARVLSRIGFKVAGALIELSADHGDSVAAGQVVARIDAREQRARAAKARAQVQSAQAAVQVAEAASRKAAAVVAQRVQTNQRRQALLARQAVSVEAAEEAQLNEGIAIADQRVAESEVEAARARLDDARAQHEFEQAILAQHELRAPFAGLVISRAKELGAVLNAGEALFTLVAPETVWMLAYVDEARSGNIELGQPVEIRLRSMPQHSFRGEVARVGIESDRVNEERRIYVNCIDCPEAFHIGEQVEVFITTAVLAQALMVPEGLIEGFDGHAGTLWTLEDGRLRRRRAAFGKRALDGRVELVGGLPPGATVPARVSASFREGRPARIRTGAP